MRPVPPVALCHSAQLLEAKRRAPEAVLDAVPERADLIVPLANGEPTTLLEVLEEGADRLCDVRIHQMHALHDRPYLHDAFPGRLRHVSYFGSSGESVGGIGALRSLRSRGVNVLRTSSTSFRPFG